MKFIHAADIHLDSPLGGLSRYEGAPAEAMRTATRRAFENLVSYTLEEDADFVLIAGDLYDTDWKDYNTGLFFNRCMSQLQEAEIPVLMVRGNHDAGCQITRQLKMPANVTDFKMDKAHTVRLDQHGVAVHGQGYPNSATTDDLSLGYPAPVPGYFNIGLLHTSVDGRPGHAPYAPCTLQGLIAKGYDYWALGHVHRREILHENPWVVFPGNIQGRNIRETGAKGCTLVAVEEGAVRTVMHHCVDVLRWVHCPIDVSAARSPEDVLEQVGAAVQQELQCAEERFLAMRIEITGACAAHNALQNHRERWVNEIRARTGEISDAVWLEKVVLNTRSPASVDDLVQQGGPLGELLQGMQALADDPAALQDLAHEFRDLRLPEKLVTGPEPLNPADPNLIRHLLPEVQQLLIAGLLNGDMA